MSTRVAAAPQPLQPVPPPPPIPYATDSSRDAEETIGGKEGRYYGYRDVAWGEGKVRMHRFLTGREGVGVKPVYGLTAYVFVGLRLDPAPRQGTVGMEG